MTTLFRRRLMPDECILLEDDNIVLNEKDAIITTWKTFRPKPEFSHGISYYVIDKGYKVSRFLKEDGTLAYIYCDIIDTTYDETTDTYTFIDLLADVIIENDGRMRVVDLDELGDAVADGTITAAQLSDALHKLNNLLTEIYDGRFNSYLQKIDKYL
ncbi:MAG: DUF402 domain-containing protein [Lachnospira sp.]